MSSEIKKIFGYDFDKDFGEEFYTLVESKKLIFFVGAGVSRLMGLPGWNELATNLIKEAFPNYIEHTTILNSIKDSKELISISYNEMKNSEDKEEKFFKCFGKALTPKKNFTFEKNVYELLSKFEANFLTTNADNLFEEILGEERCHVGPNKPDFNRFRKHLYYLHGHYTSNKNHDQDYLVFTAEQYIQRYNDTDFQAFLHSVFNQGNTIIFIGYGLNEFEIIDYIVTKIGGINQTKVYLFEPFCSNQEIIYRSRKSYFETLNIKLVPYDISEKGYMQLIDVLEYLYNKISKNVFIPIIDDFKKWCSRFDDKSSFKEILSQLKKEDNISHERTIVDELRKQNDSRWIKSFYEEGLFSPSFIDKKIISNDWPLLSLFLDWVSSGDLYAQNNAVCFLNLLSTNNIEQLKKNRFGVASTISSLILNLNNSLINNKFLTILADIVDLQGVLYYDKDNNDKLFYNIIRWHKNHINKVLEIIFSFANFEVYNDSNSFDIKRIMHRINNVIKDSKNNKKIIVVMFEFFVGLLLKLANKKQFNLFMRIYNIDNINKNNNEYWKIIIGEIIFCFNLMNDNNKYKYAKNLLGSKEIELNKLALYLARKFKLNIEFVHLKSNFFNNYYLYCELYQYLKMRVENFKIGNIERVYIYDMIEKATWGVVGNIDEYEKNNIINSKKIEILSLFEFEEFKIKKQQYEKSGFKSYDVMHISDEVDYIKVYVWEPTIKFQKENFSEEPVNNWCKKFIDTLPNDDDDRYAYAEEFVKMIMFKNKDDVKIILDDLSNIKFEILKYVVIQMQTQMEQSSNNDIIFSFCLKILERLYMQKNNLSDNNKILAKFIFRILDKTKYKKVVDISHLLDILYRWNKIFINTEVYEDDKMSFDKLINSGDYYKYTLLLNSHIELKKQNGKEMTISQKENILETLNMEKDKTLFYTLSLNYQNLLQINNNNVDCFFRERIFKDNTFDMLSLQFSILGSNYLFGELIGLITKYYLNGNYNLLHMSNDGMLLQRFYSYVMSAFNHDKIKKNDYIKAFMDQKFVDELLSLLPHRLKKDGYEFEKWVVLSWEQIKSIYTVENKNKYADKILLLFDDIPTISEETLDFFLSVVPYCNGELYFNNIKVLVKYFNIDYGKTNKFLYEIVNYFSLISKRDLDEIMNVYSFDSDRYRDATKLLLLLRRKNIITEEEAEKYVKRLKK